MAEVDVGEMETQTTSNSQPLCAATAITPNNAKTHEICTASQRQQKAAPFTTHSHASIGLLID